MLAKEVRKDRKPHNLCHSAQDGVDIPSILKRIIRSEIFKSDYERVTSAMIFNPVPYEEAVKALGVIIESRVFEKLD